MAFPTGLTLVHYVAGIGPWDWPESELLATWDIGTYFAAWAEGKPVPRNEPLEELFRELNLGAFWIDVQAIEAAVHPNRYAGMCDVVHWWEPRDSNGALEVSPVWARVPLLLLDHTNNKNVMDDRVFNFLDEAIRHDRFEQFFREQWVAGLCAFVGSVLIDPAGEVYVPGRLIGNSLSGPWKSVPYPRPLWGIVGNNPPFCDESPRGHFCGPRQFWDLDFHWAGSFLGGVCQGKLAGKWTRSDMDHVNWVLKHGQNVWNSYLSSQAWERLQSVYGSNEQYLEFGDDKTWLPSYAELPPDAITVTEVFGLSTFAALELKSDFETSQGYGRCPDCGRAQLLATGQHRDRRCDSCRVKGRRATWRKAKPPAAFKERRIPH